MGIIARRIFCDNCERYVIVNSAEATWCPRCLAQDFRDPGTPLKNRLLGLLLLAVTMGIVAVLGFLMMRLLLG